MIDLSMLPTLNAVLNAVAASLLIGGYLAIRAGRREVHKRFMLSAFATSALFLASYLTYHFQVPVTPFRGVGWTRMVYFAILIPHILLAVVVLPLALLSVYRAWRSDFTRHRRIARWTLPLWLYVSVSGVLVYLMLYVWFPGG